MKYGYDAKRGGARERGYDARWEAIRRKQLEDVPTCERCEGPGKDVDHRVSREQGGGDEPTNLQTLCHPCHSRKTVQCDGGFGNGVKAAAPRGPDAAWRSRIVGHADVAPGQIVPNPKNWRKHPRAQRKALAGALSEVGWVTGVIVNRRTGILIDGHARLEEALARKEATIPVTYVELDEREEALVLASLDPIGAMAATDGDKLQELLADISAADEGLDDMLDSMRTEDRPIRDVEVKPPPQLVWYLIGIPLSAFGDVQQHVAALEAVSGITVQSNR